MRDLRQIDLNLLIIFETIYRTGNISKAADLLGVSQPTISNALNRLRDSLDDRLFFRDKRGVVPSPRTEEMIMPVREALRLLEVALSGGQAFDPLTSTRRFKVMLAEPVEHLIMPALVAQIPHESAVTFDFFSPLVRQLEHGLIAGEIELAVMLALPTHSFPELMHEPLMPLDLVCAVRKGHPRISATTVLTDEAWKAEQHVVFNLEPGLVKNWEKIIHLRKMERNVVARVTNMGALIRMVAHSDLLGLVPRFYMQTEGESHGLIYLDLPKPMTNQKFAMIWHKRYDQDESHKWLRAQVKAGVQAAMQGLPA